MSRKGNSIYKEAITKKEEKLFKILEVNKIASIEQAEELGIKPDRLCELKKSKYVNLIQVGEKIIIEPEDTMNNYIKKGFQYLKEEDILDLRLTKQEKFKAKEKLRFAKKPIFIHEYIRELIRNQEFKLIKEETKEIKKDLYLTEYKNKFILDKGEVILFIESTGLDAYSIDKNLDKLITNPYITLVSMAYNKKEKGRVLQILNSNGKYGEEDLIKKAKWMFDLNSVKKVTMSNHWFEEYFRRRAILYNITGINYINSLGSKDNKMSIQDYYNIYDENTIIKIAAMNSRFIYLSFLKYKDDEKKKKYLEYNRKNSEAYVTWEYMRMKYIEFINSSKNHKK